MSIESMSSEDNVKLRHVLDTGIRTTNDIAVLREGLKETIKAVAEELQIDAKDLRKAIRCAIKENIEDEKAQVENIAMILSVVGRN
jgi:uncharacterized protein (DUF433 family)